MEKLNSARHSKYLLSLHIVWIPRLRRAVLAPYKEELIQSIKDIAADKNYEILAVEVMPDHIHLFVSVPPTVAPCEVVKTFKGQSGRKMLHKYPVLASKSKDGSLWTHSYFVASAGNVSSDTIQRYIEEQNS